MASPAKGPEPDSQSEYAEWAEGMKWAQCNGPNGLSQPSQPNLVYGRQEQKTKILPKLRVILETRFLTYMGATGTAILAALAVAAHVCCDRWMHHEISHGGMSHEGYRNLIWRDKDIV